MRRLEVSLCILTCLAVLTSCGPAGKVPDRAVESTPTELQQSPSGTQSSPESISGFPAAESISLTSAGDTVYRIVGREHALYVSHSIDGGQTFSEPVSATGHATPHILQVERPAIAANENGQVTVAWLELDPGGGGNKVWYASSTDGGASFSEAALVSEEAPGETTMVVVILDESGNPLLTWLSGNDLRFARSTDKGETFLPAKTVGEGACECCQPDMLLMGERMLIGYRGLGEDETGAFRDAALIQSPDLGETFEPVSFATDSHWYINACPISGPSIAMKEDEIYITWMDGRAVAPDNLMSSDVWFAASTDGGQTFSANVKVSGASSTHNFLPVMVMGPSGRVHLAWQAISVDAIYYAFSDDGGKTFSAPQVIADDTISERGRPVMPSMTIDARGRVYLAWLDDAGVRLKVWKDLE